VHQKIDEEPAKVLMALVGDFSEQGFVKNPGESGQTQNHEDRLELEVFLDFLKGDEGRFHMGSSVLCK
jgi:hypothetical protein